MPSCASSASLNYEELDKTQAIGTRTMDEGIAFRPNSDSTSVCGVCELSNHAYSAGNSTASRGSLNLPEKQSLGYFASLFPYLYFIKDSIIKVKSVLLIE